MAWQAALPYILAAYGGYQGYQANKKAGASGLERILGGITGAGMGYYGGTKLAGTGNYTPFLQTSVGQSVAPYVPSFMKTTAGGTTGTVAANSPFSQPGLSSIAETDTLVRSTPGEIDPLKLFTGVGLGSYLSGAFEQGPVDMYQPTYNLGYAQMAKEREGFSYIDPATGIEKEYEDVWIPEGNVEGNPYQMVKTRLSTGGLAEIKKFSEGGVNYLPSKITHDEYDSNNYVRASGYVEDGSGTGDKDEDTMLAQLADGEFVTRADGVLGAGIIAGANPNSIKEMREKGAQYFYDQQKRYKRIFNIIKGRDGTDKQKN
jgi:hypothetical protein